MLQLLNAYNQIRADRKNKAVKDGETKPTENITMDINDDYLFIVKYSCKTINMFEKKLHKKENRRFKKVENKMKKLSQGIVKDSMDSKFDNIIALAMTYFNFGLMYKNYFRNSFIAEEYLIQCTELLKGRELDPKAIVLVVEAYIELSYLWRDIPNPEKYYTTLIKALEAYSNYMKKEDKYLSPIIIENVLGIFEGKEKEDPKFYLDLLHSIILTHLGQLYHSNPEDKHEFIIYMQNFLINHIPNVSLYGTQIEFTLASLELSRYFIMHNNFIEAKNYLAAGSYMLQTYKEKVMTIPVEDEDILDDYHEAYMTGYIKSIELWLFYGITLLYVSKNKLSQSGKDQTLCKIDNSKSKDGSTKFLIFSNISFNLSETFTNVTDKYLLNFNDAEVMVKHILMWFKSIESYYRFQNDLVTVARMALCISTAYKYLTCFEPDRDKQIQWHKQRIRVLKNASEISNKQFYISAKHIYKLIRLELAIVHLMVVDIINENLQIKDDDPTEELSIDKCNSLCNSLNSFKKYIECS